MSDPLGSSDATRDAAGLPHSAGVGTVTAGVRKAFEAAIAVFPSRRSASNVAWNLLGGASTGVFVVLATPVYVSRLGLEGYGIVGLWLVFQVMMGMLDVGMGATVVKAFAASRPDRAGHELKRDLLRTLETFYWAVAVLLCVVIALSAGYIGAHWLKVNVLSPTTVTQALQLMALAMAFQFPMSLYANGLAGLQEHGRMNALQIIGNLMRYGGGVVVLLWRADVVWFFVIQASVAACQTLVMRHVLKRMIVALADRHPVFRPELIRKMWRYSAGMAFSSLGAVLMANADRIALSTLLPTAELGRYSIAFTATGLLQLAIQPFHRSFFPRFAELVSTGDSDVLRHEYFRSCQLVAFLIIPLGVVGWTFAAELLASWLGRSDETVTTVFRWLLIGITCSGLMWLPAAMQQANGWTRLHAGMIAGALVFGTPLMIWAIRTLGTVGATTVWVLHGITGITLELWLMHRRLLIGDLGEWYRTVLLPPLVLTLPLAVLSRVAMPEHLGRWTSFGWVAGTGFVVIAAAMILRLVRIRLNLRMTPA